MFRSPFQSPFQNPFSTEGAAAVNEWWLSGDIDSANAIAAYQPIGADDLADSYINLANPGTNDAAPGVAPTWDAVNGWIGDGLSTYLDTGIIPASGYSVVVRYTNASALEVILGSFKTGARFDIWGNDNGKVQYNSGTTRQVSPFLTSGVLGIAGQQGYRNGIPDGLPMSAWTDTADLSINMLRLNRSPGSVFYLSGQIQSLAIYNATITDAQMLAVTNAMNLL